MGYINEIAGYRANVTQLIWCYQTFRRLHNHSNHINLRKRADHTDNQAAEYGNKSLYDHSKKQYVIDQSEYTDYCDFVDDGTYVYTKYAIEQVKQYTDLTIGRARFLTLPAKSCLTLHTDNDSALRFHIPVITNPSVFFVINDKVERMVNTGSLYTLQTNELHTVVNASRTDRVHLVVDGYRK